MKDPKLEAALVRTFTQEEQWPTALEALLCVDCEKFYARGGLCPWCGSAAAVNIAALIAGEMR